MKDRRWDAALALCAGALLVLYAMGAVGLCGTGLWGLTLGGRLPMAALIPLLIIAAACCVPPVGHQLLRVLRRADAWLGARRLRGLLALELVCLLLLLLLHSHKAYYGLPLALNDLDRVYPTNPLSNLFLRLVSALFSGLALAAPLAHELDPLIALASICAGALLIPLLWSLAGRIAPQGERLPAFALLLFAPSLALFAGHREIYFAPVLAMALFCLALIHDLREDALPWRSGSAGFAAVGAHMLNASVLPVLLLIGLTCGRRFSRSKRAAALLGPFVAGAALIAAWAAWDLHARGASIGPYELLGSFAHLQSESYGLFWIAWLDHQAPAGMFSQEHLEQFYNQLLLHCPLLIVLIAALPNAIRKALRGDRALGALLLLWLGALVVAVIDRPIGGHLSQWAHSSNLALVTTVVFVYVFYRVLDGARRDAAAAALIGLSAFHTLSLMLVNRLNLGPYLGFGGQ
ncbi:MAG: hypothetical protein P9M14_12015 [Candidatus Alcyoniella australis]|nr:hypothetical protein [Candidatus Alcyoniella australis]